MRDCLPKVCLLLALATIGVSAAAPQQAAYRIVTYMKDYDQPGAITEGSPGVLYFEVFGNTRAVFSTTTQGAKTLIAQFPSGYEIPSALVAGSNTRFYSGVQHTLASANVFSVGSAAGSAKIYAPQNLDPILIQSLPDSTFLGFGITVSGNPYHLAKVDLSGTVTPVYQFGSYDLPDSVVYGTDGNFYGVVQETNASTGYVFRITPSGSLTTVYSFPSNTFPGYFGAPLIQATDGNLYGALPTGGLNAAGAIYRLTVGGEYTEIYSFPSVKYGRPQSLIQASDGNLYGTTLGDIGSSGASGLFRVSTSGQYTTLFVMSNLTVDGACGCSIVQGSDGIIYGTADGGGVTGGGAIFALDAGLPKPSPSPQKFHPRSGAVGTQVLIWGNNLLSPSVLFNGVPATSVASSGSNYVWAIVPAGASTGPITVTTPGGSGITPASFAVE